LLYQLS